MKLQMYVPDIVDKLKTHRYNIITHMFYLSCLQHAGAETAPNDVVKRLLWDLTRVPDLKEIMTEVRNSGGLDVHTESMMRAVVRELNVLGAESELLESTKRKCMTEAVKVAKEEKEKSTKEKILRMQEEEKERLEKEDEFKTNLGNLVYGTDFVPMQFMLDIAKKIDYKIAPRTIGSLSKNVAAVRSMDLDGNTAHFCYKKKVRGFTVTDNMITVLDGLINAVRMAGSDLSRYRLDNL